MGLQTKLHNSSLRVTISVISNKTNFTNMRRTSMALNLGAHHFTMSKTLSRTLPHFMLW